MTKDFNLSDHVLVAERTEKEIHAYMEEDVKKFLDLIIKLAGERLCPKPLTEKVEKKNTNSAKN